MYLTVGTVDERSFSQQVLEEGRQVSGQQTDVQNLGHPSRHIHHGLMREAHVQSSVASFQPGTDTHREQTQFRQKGKRSRETLEISTSAHFSNFSINVRENLSTSMCHFWLNTFL